MNLFILWTTFICFGGEIAKPPFTVNMYSSAVYTDLQQVDKVKIRWQKNYTRGDCAPFMIQHEDVTETKFLQQLLRIY